MLVSSNNAVEAIEYISSLEQIEIETHHTIHGGLYTRTIKLNKNEILASVIIKIPTTLIVSGKIIIYSGDDEVKVSGYNVIPASEGRQQIMKAIEETTITMMFPTMANTVEDAEAEFTDYSDLLMSRFNKNNTIITGE